MADIPAACVEIGAPAEHLDAVGAAHPYGRRWFGDEAPQHTQTVAAFSIDRHLVTNADYAEFVDATGYLTQAELDGSGLVYGHSYWDTVAGVCWRHPAPGIDAVTARPLHPVVHVTHSDATAFAEWAGKRLPTEAEWEYAAHGPTWQAWPWGHEWLTAAANTAVRWAGGDIDLAGWRAWWASRHAARGPDPCTTPVGQFTAGNSPFGVADMAGNVAEWTGTFYSLYDPADLYDPAYIAAAEFGDYRVVRGGSWKHFPTQTRTTERIACLSRYSSFEIGFRCVTSSDPDQR
ncbi:formylglycine-generating enzyme family protein [Nocardia sp. NPDC058379]|uniref:formylglycine-generating enzyme family protein n=1 Tax=unclassified Nocardia TaxID=2637762 RepID=UPI0036650E57